MTSVDLAAASSVERVLSADRLDRYADTLVRSCLRLGDDEQLFVSCQPSHRELAVAIAEAAYRAGARLVEIYYQDPLVSAARIRHARDEHLGPVPPWVKARVREQIRARSASVTITGEDDPGAFDGLPPARVAVDSQRPLERMPFMVRAHRETRFRWSGIGWPTAYWAARVYPELEPGEARRRLAEDLLWFCRLGPDDPPGFEGWEAHVDLLAARGERLTELRLERLELRGPGTSLELRLAPGTRWLGGRERNAFGQLVAPNFPTEENFTSPDAAGTEGTFRCSRPLSFRGRMIEGIAGEFHRGRLVRLEAATEEDRDFLAAFLAVDRNASRLGEVALVDRSSRIGRTDRVYSNTLIDENAAAHIAFGVGFGQTRLPDPAARGARGVNRAKLHLDVMIGTDDFDATGVTADGHRVPLLRDGTWKLDD